MKLLLVRPICVLLFATFVVAQRGPGGGGAGSSGPSSPNMPPPGINSRPQNTLPDLDRPVFITGKVVLSDGSQVTEPAAIMTVCSTRRRVEGYTDSRGNFSFELKKKSSNMAPQAAEISSYNEDIISKANTTAFQWNDCELQAVLPGFASDSVSLARYVPLIETTDIGHITLTPMNDGGSGSILSATSLAAPNNARKAFEKARDLEKKNKMDEAAVSLQKAVGIYPQYAAAWAELGRLQYLKHDAAGSKHAYEQARAADEKYAKPYLGLAQLAVDAGQWQSVVDVTHKLLTLNSVNFPVAWLLNSVGHFNLHNFEEAENSARDGLKVDSGHSVPRLEYLLGLILAQKHDYTQSAEHIRGYLKLASQPAEIAEAQKVLAQVEQMSSTAGVVKSEK